MNPRCRWIEQEGASAQKEPNGILDHINKLASIRECTKDLVCDDLGYDKMLLLYV